MLSVYFKKNTWLGQKFFCILVYASLMRVYHETEAVVVTRRGWYDHVSGYTDTLCIALLPVWFKSRMCNGV